MPETGFVDERSAIEQRFYTQWAAITPIKFENVEFVQPEASPWVSLIIQRGSGDQIDIGTSNPTHRYNGVINVQIFTPQLTGTRSQGSTAADALADKVSGIFRNAQFSSGALGTIRCRTPRIVVSGNDPYGWYQINVLTPYVRDQNF
jgi:hypothetical protein